MFLSVGEVDKLGDLGLDGVSDTDGMAFEFGCMTGGCDGCK